MSQIPHFAMRSSFPSVRRRIAVSSLVIFISSTVCSSAAFAADRYWRGQMNNSNEYENPINWSATNGGDGGVAAPTASDNVFFMSNSSGSALLGRNVIIRSHASMKGLVINRNMTGTILLGTGSLNFGSDGIRMGSGRLIGSGHKLGSTSNLSGSGSFTMTGGIVRLGATNLYLSGSLAISKGAGSSYTEFVSTGSIVFNSRLADQNFTVGSTVSNTFFKNLTLNNTAGTTSDDIIVSGTPLKLSGALLITRGNLDLAANDVVLLVESGITLASHAQATFSTDANVTASGHIVVGALGVFTMSGTSTLKLNGVNQNFDTNNNPLYNLTVAPSGTVSLTSDQSVTNILQINTGSTLSLGAFTIYATGATIINYGTIAEGAGKIEHSATTVKLTDSTYAEDDSFTTGDTVYITLTDSDENIDGTAADTVTVTVTLASGDSEDVTLTETSNTSGVFRGSILTATQTNTAGIVADNGYLEAPSSTSITLSYTDAQDDGTGTDSASLTVSSSTASAATTAGGGGGRRGGGSSVPASGETVSTSQSSAAAGGDLPQVRGNLSVSISGKAVVLKDVPVSQWFAPYILALVQAGVISGYRDARGNPTGEFKPGNNVTYAEIAKMAVQAAGLTPKTGVTPNTRSARGQWSAGYIAALEELGVSVFSAGLDANAPAPRGVVLQIILEAFGQTIPAARGGVYSDVSAQSAHAGAIESATAAGIVSGDDGRSTFRPNAAINRAETSKIVRNAMQKLSN
ncbi:MAG: S-layer homology domain-containing protein [Candidatus Peregrinibacteria bacterium]